MKRVLAKIQNFLRFQTYVCNLPLVVLQLLLVELIRKLSRSPRLTPFHNSIFFTFELD
jgi:hypothetical protein